MFLKTLLIENNGSIIRKIRFNKGVNLIVDETSQEEKKTSGNNVGKTTALRLIDYCLGSDGKNIYTDPEFKKKTNQVVENFLKENNIIITLTLSTDLNNEDEREIVIRRNFFMDKKNTILEVNGEKIAKKDLQSHLKKIFFNSSAVKPTFRQIISKNIRDDKARLTNTIKVLHPTTKSEEYEALYFFWFGIDLDSAEEKQKLLAQKTIEENLQKRLKKDSSISQVIQSLIVINDNIKNLEESKANFNINENYEYEINRLNEVKLNINRSNTELSRLTLRKDLIEESVSELNEEFANIDVEKIDKLYKEAKALMPFLQKTFEETLKFHNGMLEEKKKFISSDLPELNLKIETINAQIDKLLKEESLLTSSLIKSGKLEDLQDIIYSLNNAYEQKGALEEQKRLWEKSNDTLEKIVNKLDEIDNDIHSLNDKLQEKIAIFNKYFSKMSERLYGEKFVLSADIGEKGYELNITSLFNNPGTGRKKGEMAAFDLAYIQFADAVDIDCLHFVLQDQIENTHDNQITSLFTDIVKSVNCQYILSVLKDKLPSDINIDELEVLKLSQHDKLFRI
ncbi:DUF2326 domain-containing protein [Proteus mirabilis]|uniref:DUF2326 domain-containing protein n=1 Tax=Proteus columbae TaxID=1987580 RepID=UPI000C1F9110|nr:DUF2326 domain-containing protein [Proteus columbae]MBG2712356.1 DUF2326 domain-containing protein [Proteus mirabilis]MBG2769053.1 DUF2326 domain-containing protein [Proteus mirabilis]